jgi:hypothetical protein
MAPTASAAHSANEQQNKLGLALVFNESLPV